jgi:hypothetical protein
MTRKVFNREFKLEAVKLVVSVFSRPPLRRFSEHGACVPVKEVDTCDRAHDRYRAGIGTAAEGDGRCVYDKAAKAELVRRCQRPGVSIAKLALAHGVLNPQLAQNLNIT